MKFPRTLIFLCFTFPQEQWLFDCRKSSRARVILWGKNATSKLTHQMKLNADVDARTMEDL